MNFLIKLIILVAIAMILQFTAVFASKLGDKVNRKRMERLKEQNKRLIEQMKRYENDYHSIYENMVHVNTMKRELEKENDELKKELDKQGRVPYNYYVNKQEETTMTTFIILAKRHTQTIQLSYLAENMRAAIDEFRLTYPKKHYTIIDCKEATNYNRQEDFK